MTYKQCSRCGKRKGLERFHRSSKGAGGRHAWCKDCVRDYKENEWRPGAPHKNARQREHRSGVYVLTNPAWPEWVKVGSVHSEKRDPREVRLRTFNLGSPHRDYEIPFFFPSDGAALIELETHLILGDDGAEMAGEWARCDVATARAAIEKAAR